MIARFRAWRRYNKRLDELVTAHYAQGYNISPATFAAYRAQARTETQSPDGTAAVA